MARKANNFQDLNETFPQGFKRNYNAFSDEKDNYPSKRFCQNRSFEDLAVKKTLSSTNFQNKKNLAQNRLSRIQNKIKEDLKRSNDASNLQETNLSLRNDSFACSNTSNSNKRSFNESKFNNSVNCTTNHFRNREEKICSPLKNDKLILKINSQQKNFPNCHTNQSPTRNKLNEFNLATNNTSPSPDNKTISNFEVNNDPKRNYSNKSYSANNRLKDLRNKLDRPNNVSQPQNVVITVRNNQKNTSLLQQENIQNSQYNQPKINATVRNSPSSPRLLSPSIESYSSSSSSVSKNYEKLSPAKTVENKTCRENFFYPERSKSRDSSIQNNRHSVDNSFNESYRKNLPHTITSQEYETSETSRNSNTFEFFNGISPEIDDESDEGSKNFDTLSGGSFPRYKKAYEDMDWSDKDEEIEETEFAVTKTNGFDAQESNDSSCSISKKNNGCCYLIVDTNIYLKNLSLLEKITDQYKNKVVLYTPWMVINELDSIKIDKSVTEQLQKQSVKAIKFINRMLLSNNNSMLGQTVFEVDEQKYRGKSPDQKILGCCLQAKKKFKKVILLTNDINLSNMALLNGVSASSSESILKKLSEDSRALRFVAMMGQNCSTIITRCAEKAFGRAFQKMSQFSKPPWVFKECLKIFKKYWISVFNSLLLKQFLITVDSVELMLERFNDLEETETFNKFLRLCMEMCNYLKDIDMCQDVVKTMIMDIKSLYKT